MAKKSKWTDIQSAPITVLNYAKELQLARFTRNDLMQVVGCDGVWSISLGSSTASEPVDLAPLAHVKSLRGVRLVGLKFTNLPALRALPHLQQISMDRCRWADFDELNGFHALKRLSIQNAKLTQFPLGLDLPQLESLDLSFNRIADVGFCRSYRGLSKLSLNDNLITDASALAACCPGLKTLSLEGNPISSLAVLTGCQFDGIYLDARLQEEVMALQLELPRPPSDAGPDPYAAPWRLASEAMKARDWTAVRAITDMDVLAKAFLSFTHGYFDEEALRAVLEHPVPGAFDAMVSHGLPAHSGAADLLVQVLTSYGERLVPPLTACFDSQLAKYSAWHGDDFLAGKLKEGHALIVKILVEAASPAYTDLFLAFFNQRHQFSAIHLGYYKKLLDVVGKTKSPLLVEPLIDLLRFEKYIVGGDAAFMRKIFKAIGQLGTNADVAALTCRFDAAAETRPDVLQAYEATLTRLHKKRV